MTSATQQPEPLFTEISARRLGPVRTFFAQRPVVMDVLIMVLFAFPALVTSFSSPETDPEIPGSGPSEAQMLTALAFVALTTTALFWRRRRPVATLVAVTSLTVLSALTTSSTHGLELAVALSLYAIAASHRSAITWTAFGLSQLAVGGAVWFFDKAIVGPEDSLEGISVEAAKVTALVMLVLAALLAIAIGTSVRGRRQHIADLVARANALARDRDQQAQLARAAERGRIAREMHDVVAHSLSVMIALADGAGAALTKSPERAKLALDELSSTGRSALADMRRVLGVLAEPEAPLEPQPDSQDLAELVDRFRAAGMTIHARGLSTPLPEDAGFQLAVFRIVQEALTNTLRHAPQTARAEVEIARTSVGIEVTVSDQGPGVIVTEPQTGSGRGVIGMRERVGVYGGVAEAGPWEGGWRVHAVLPWGAEGWPVEGPRKGEGPA